MQMFPRAANVARELCSLISVAKKLSPLFLLKCEKRPSVEWNRFTFMQFESKSTRAAFTQGDKNGRAIVMPARFDASCAVHFSFDPIAIDRRELDPVGIDPVRDRIVIAVSYEFYAWDKLIGQSHVVDAREGAFAGDIEPGAVDRTADGIAQILVLQNIKPRIAANGSRVA